MSTFTGFIPELPGIAIDCFEDAQRSKSSMFFLSHCHADHMRGLERNAPLPGALHLSPISGVFIKHRYPQHADVVRSFNVGEQLALKVHPSTGEPPYELYVRSLSAEHCPGSVMFYFEGNATRVLYTGDFRLSSQKNFTTQSSGIQPAIVYLDSTFLDADYSYFPSREESTARVINLCTEWLAADQRNVVSLWLPANYGSEDLFLRLFDRLKERIHISDKQRAPYMHFSSLNDILTGDSSTRIHACTGTMRSSRNLTCETLCNEDSLSFVRTIRPSALRWRGLQPTEQFWKESNNLFYVCYSAHASCNELGAFLAHFQQHLCDIRLNVIADEDDRVRKEHLLESILGNGINRATNSNGTERRDKVEDGLSLNLNKIEYKTKRRTNHRAGETTESSESEDNDCDLSYRKLPKRSYVEKPRAS
ncbi:AGAP000597-PA-like protein [Anopheles sinensis]|uniref:Protein artemis n=1 Tax=Anopheles sinensis TaxID=74873 RepID=A0A084VV34_ANOSI|nr:AGAP000597-PA-like protein [Anopheles sinensis]